MVSLLRMLHTQIHAPLHLYRNEHPQYTPLCISTPPPPRSDSVWQMLPLSSTCRFTWQDRIGPRPIQFNGWKPHLWSKYPFGSALYHQIHVHTGAEGHWYNERLKCTILCTTWNRNVTILSSIVHNRRLLISRYRTDVQYTHIQLIERSCRKLHVSQ